MRGNVIESRSNCQGATHASAGHHANHGIIAMRIGWREVGPLESESNRDAVLVVGQGPISQSFGHQTAILLSWLRLMVG